MYKKILILSSLILLNSIASAHLYKIHFKIENDTSTSIPPTNNVPDNSGWAFYLNSVNSSNCWSVPTSIPEHSFFIGSSSCAINDQDGNYPLNTNLGVNHAYGVLFSPSSNLKNLDFMKGFVVSDSYVLFNGVNLDNADGLSDLTHVGFGDLDSGVDLSNNNLTHINGLSSLIYLDGLLLNNNNIEDISGLSSLKFATFIDLRGNNISDYSPLSNLNGTYNEGEIPHPAGYEFFDNYYTVMASVINKINIDTPTGSEIWPTNGSNWCNTSAYNYLNHASAKSAAQSSCNP